MCVLKGKNWTFSLQNLIVYPNPSNPNHLKLKHLTNPLRHFRAGASLFKMYCVIVSRQPAGEKTTLPLSKSNITIDIAAERGREGGREGGYKYSSNNSPCSLVGIFDLFCICVVFLKTNFSTTLICFTFGFAVKIPFISDVCFRGDKWFRWCWRVDV